MKRAYFLFNVLSFTIKFFLIYAAGLCFCAGAVYGIAILLEELSQHRLTWAACKWLAGAALLIFAILNGIAEAREDRRRSGF